MIFSPLQQEILDSNGALLIQGVPGSGKSSVIAERVKRFIESREFSKINILAPSYLSINKIKLILGNEYSIKSEQLAGKVDFNTFKTISLKILLRFGSYIGMKSDFLVIDSINDKLSILADIVFHDPIYKTISHNSNELSDFLSKCLSLISNHKKQFITPELSVEPDPFPRIYRKYNESLRLRNTSDYDDVLFYATRLLIENEGLIHIYTDCYSQFYILDALKLNESHYLMFQALVGAKAKRNASLFMVGDLYPSISSTPVKYTQNFILDFKPKIYNLTETYKTSNKIVAFVNHLTKLNVSLPCHNDGELKINFFKNETEEAKFVCYKIYELLHADQHSTTYDEICIIARNKYSFTNITSEFSRSNIPFSFLKSDYNISTESDVFKVLYSVMKMINNPNEIIHKNLLCKLLEREELIISKNQDNLVEQILVNTKFDWMIDIICNLSRENTLDFIDILNNLNHHLPQHDSDYYNYFFENDLREWSEQWKRFRKRYAQDKWLIYTFLCSLHLGEDLNLNLPSSVKLLTPDMFANYTFDSVFIIELAEDSFPDYRAISLGESAILRERDILQAAVNSSKRLCYLSCAKSKEFPGNKIKFLEPSRFIADYHATDPSGEADNYKLAKEIRSSQIFKKQ
jgi:DNA helicase-2/ATP-dependent DNA helicase PcrA